MTDEQAEKNEWVNSLFSCMKAQVAVSVRLKTGDLITGTIPKQEFKHTFCILYEHDGKIHQARISLSQIARLSGPADGYKL